MRTSSMKTMIELANKGTTDLHKIVQQSTEIGMVVPSVLKSKLEVGGYLVTFHSDPDGGPNTGNWVRVSKDNTIIARAYSHDQNDSLVQAILGWLKENVG